MRCLAILTVRNEGAFLLEWLAHHQAVGFTDFLIFSNDCQDGTDAILDRLQDMGELVHHRNDGPYDKRGIQFTALKTAEKIDLVQQADWILPLDVDEFVNIHAGDGTLPALLLALPDATAITLTWRLFGNAGVETYDDTPALQTFTRCAPVAMFWPWRSAMFKTLYKNDGTYAKVGVHRPRNPDKSRLAAARWYDGEGRLLSDQFKTTRVFSDYGRSNYKYVQLNHYPLGAKQSYVLKADRGRAVHGDDVLGLDYWVERNFNTDEDTSIHRMADRAAPHLHRYFEDPTLAHLHANAAAWRKARFDELMLQDAYRALYGRLLMTPETQLTTREQSRILVNYGLRARAQNGDVP